MTHRRARSFVLATSAACAIACTKSPRVETRAVTSHVPAACAMGEGAYALFYASGDFDARDPSALALGDVGAPLTEVPEATRAITVDATDATDGVWRARGDVPASGDVDLLLLRYRAPCPLGDAAEGPEAAEGAAFGAIDGRRVLLAGGRAAGSAVPRTWVVDLATGGVAPLEAGLLVPRVDATVTPFGDGGLVAGGRRTESGELLASAEVFRGSDFDGELLTLSEARAGHGAVTLGSGETLLVGGEGANGPLATLEIVDPVARRARTAGLASLAVARVHPSVMRLANGEILVAGGVDAKGAPVATLEWLTPDARAAARRPRDLVASSRRAFVPLSAGGALAVIAPDEPTPGFENVWVIAADGALEDATPIEGALTTPRLFEGSEGAPILWTGDRWLAWAPWGGGFEALAGAETASGPPEGAIAAQPTADDGVALWASGGRVTAMRFGTRGAYAATPASRPLLRTDPAFTAPDRLVTADGGTGVAFDPSRGLVLRGDASVFVTDATYAHLDASFTVPSGVAPRVVLRDGRGAESVVDAAACALGGPTAGGPVRVVRDGAHVRASVGGAALADCAVSLDAAARVAFGLRAPSGGGEATARALVVSRE